MALYSSSTEIQPGLSTTVNGFEVLKENDGKFSGTMDVSTGTYADSIDDPLEQRALKWILNPKKGPNVLYRADTHDLVFDGEELLREDLEDDFYEKETVYATVRSLISRELQSRYPGVAKNLIPYIILARHGDYDGDNSTHPLTEDGKKRMSSLGKSIKDMVDGPIGTIIFTGDRAEDYTRIIESIEIINPLMGAKTLEDCRGSSYGRYDSQDRERNLLEIMGKHSKDLGAQVVLTHLPVLRDIATKLLDSELGIDTTNQEIGLSYASALVLDQHNLTYNSLPNGNFTMREKFEVGF